MVFPISVVLARADSIHLVYKSITVSLLRERAVEVIPEFVQNLCSEFVLPVLKGLSFPWPSKIEL